MSDLPRYVTFGLPRAALRLDEAWAAARPGATAADGRWLAVTLGNEAPSRDVLGDVRAPAASFWITATGRL